MKKTLIAAGIILVGFVGCTALITSEDYTSTNPTQSISVEQKTQPEVKEPTPLNTSAAVTADRSITVTGLSELNSINSEFMGSVESDGGKLIAVYFTAENTGMDSGDMSFTNMALIYSQGRSYDTQGLGDKNDQMFPGGSTDSVEVFRVAPDATDFTLKIKNTEFATQ